MIFGRRVLIGDDDGMVRDLLGNFLSSKGYETTAAADLKECLTKVESECPDVVLLDVGMCGDKSIKATDTILEMNEKTVVIMISGSDNDDIGNECLKRGACDYVTKPLDMRYLEKRLSLEIGRRRVQRLRESHVD